MNEIAIEFKLLLFLLVSLIPGIVAHIVAHLICKKKDCKIDRPLYLVFYFILPLCIWIACFFVSFNAKATTESNTYNLNCIENTDTAEVYWSNTHIGQVCFYYEKDGQKKTLQCPLNKGVLTPSNTNENTVTVTTYTYENKILNFFLGKYNEYLISLSDESFACIFKADYVQTS